MITRKKSRPGSLSIASCDESQDQGFLFGAFQEPAKSIASRQCGIFNYVHLLSKSFFTASANWLSIKTWHPTTAIPALQWMALSNASGEPAPLVNS